MIKALIFDFDGLIVDTETPAYHAFCKIYREYGKELPLEMYARCVGTSFEFFNPYTYLAELLEQAGDAEQIRKQVDVCYRELLKDRRRQLSAGSQRAGAAGLHRLELVLQLDRAVPGQIRPARLFRIRQYGGFGQEGKAGPRALSIIAAKAGDPAGGSGLFRRFLERVYRGETSRSPYRDRAERDDDDLFVRRLRPENPRHGSDAVKRADRTAGEAKPGRRIGIIIL